MTDTATPEVIEQRNTYRVHESNIGRANELVEKVNRKARRYGLSEYALNISEPVLVPVEAEALGFLDETAFETYYDIELVGEMPQIDGWTFVATLDYEEESGVITRVVPGVEVDLSAHRPRPADCDHCGQHRQRNATYVLRSTTTGETMQVGSTCIQPYMGLSVNGLAWIAGEPFAELSEMEEPTEREYGGRRTASRFSVDSVLTTTMGVEQLSGWVSRAVAEEYGKTATSAEVFFLLNPPYNDKDRMEQRRMIAAIDWDAAQEKAEKVKAWAVSQTMEGEWAENLRTLAGGETVTYRNVGLLASAVAGYNRAEGMRIEREQRVPSEWVGEPGAKGPKAKINVEGTVAQAFTSENEWGVSTLYIIRGEGVSFKVRIKGIPFRQGDKLTGTAKVKAHETYRDEKQTVIWYAKLDKAE